VSFETATKSWRQRVPEFRRSGNAEAADDKCIANKRNREKIGLSTLDDALAERMEVVNVTAERDE